MNRDLIALVAAVGFFFLGGVTAWRAGKISEAHQKLLVMLLVSWVVAAGMLAGVSRRDLWPFSAWNLMPSVPPDTIGGARSIMLHFVGVTPDGNEYPVDYRSFDPLSHVEFGTWLGMRLLTLDSAAQAVVGQRLLDQANWSRQRVLRGDPPGYTDRWGVLSAPSHFLHRGRWFGPADVPDEPFTQLRIYQEHWNVSDRIDDPDRYVHRLFFEYRSAP